MSRTAFSERSPDNAQYFRKTLAQRLYLPQLRQPEGLGTCRQALHLRMRRLRPTNFRDRQNRLPSQPPAASHLVPSISPQGLLRRIRLAPLANFSGASIGGSVPAPSRKAQPSSAMASRPIEISRTTTVRATSWARWRHASSFPGSTAHGVFVNFKQRTLGSYHGVQKPHLQRYLDEFVFRWNRRRHVASSLEALFESPPPFLTLDIGPSWIT